MKGWFVTVIMEKELFMIEFFKFLRIGFASINDLTGNAKAIIVGIWKIETNITFAFRKKMDWHEAGEA
jgi:hypothetical protein